MPRGRGILSIRMEVFELDEHGNKKLKKLILNEDHEVPTHSKAMSGYDKLALAIGSVTDKWGDETSEGA